MSSTRRAVLAVSASLALAACSDPPTAPVLPGTLRLTVVSGDGQSASAGAELPQPLVVKIIGSNGKGVKGQLVNFRVTGGGGRMYAGSSMTDAMGQAQDYWTLGIPGPQQVEVVAVEPTTGAKQNFGSFTATALAPAALSISPANNNFGTWPVGGSSGTTVFTVTNTGDEPSGPVSVSLGGANAADFAIAGTTCVGVLAGAATCTVSVRFAPLTAGSRSASLLVSAIPGGSVTSALTGSAVAAAISVTPSTFNFGGVLVGGTSVSQTFTVQNTGGAAANALVVTIGGTNAADFQFSGNTCTGVTINPGQTCLVGVFFRPIASGSRSATLNVAASGGVTGSAALSGTGTVPPTLSITPPSFNYGSVNVGSNGSAQSFTVTNTGGSVASGITAAISGANVPDFPVLLNTCTGVSLSPGQTCTVVVGFAPTALGTRSASLTATSPTASTGTASLTGTGAAGTAVLSISPTSHNFGSVVIGGTPGTRLFTVTNSGGTATGTLATSLTGTNASQFSIVSDNCNGAVLAAAAQCTLTVELDPTILGSLSAQLSVVASPGGTVTSTLTGTAVAASQLAVSPSSLTFGNQVVRTTSTPQRITITNNGGTTVSPIQFALQGAAPNDYVIANFTCGAGLAPGASCFLDIAFSPVALGVRAATAVISAPNFQFTVTLSGTGI